LGSNFLNLSFILTLRVFRTIDTVYKTKAIQIRPKANACSVLKLSPYITIPISSIIDGPMYCIKPTDESGIILILSQD